MIFAGVSVSLLSGLFGNGNWSFLIFIIMIPVFCFFGMRRLKQQNEDFPIRVDLSNDTDGRYGRLIHSSDIRTVLVRENTGRDHCEDHAMAQIYLLHQGAEYPILVNQHYMLYRDTVVVLAKRIAQHIDAELENQLDAAE